MPLYRKSLPQLSGDIFLADGGVETDLPHAAVVGPDLKVRGIERLRVCDASVFPTMLSGNLNAPTIMVFEKGADLIR